MKLAALAVCLALTASRGIWAGDVAEVMTLDEAATWLRVPPDGLAVLAGRGDLPGRNLGAFGWRFDRAALQAWLANRPLAAPDSPVMEARTAALPSPAKPSESEMASERRSSAPTAEEMALRGISPLNKPGSFSLEFTMSHSFDDSNGRSLTLFGGRDETVADSAVLGLRYHFDARNEVFFSLPYSLERSKSEDFFTGEVTRASSQGFAPVRFGMRRILLDEAVGRPQMVATADLSVPLRQDQDPSFGLEFALLKSMDPISLFASLRWQRVYASDGRESQDALIADLGYVYALNDRVALSAALTMRFEDEVDPLTESIRSAQHYGLRLGMPTNFGDGALFVEPHVVFGLNQGDGATSVGVSLVKAWP